jgi:holo-[acyl-carrier protein] synthase
MKFFVGNDLVHIPSFRKSLNPAFIQRIFTEKEIEQIEQYRANPAIRYATTWAAKESVIKVLKQFTKSPLGLSWKDIEIVRVNKIPKVTIKKKYYKTLSFSLSLSHHHKYAFAVVIACPK